MLKTEAATMTVAAVTTTAGGITAVLPPGDMLDEWRLLGLCIAGALGGAFLAVALWTPDQDHEINILRRLLLKFGASFAAGVTFAPAALTYWSNIFAPAGGLPRASYVLGVSSAIAAFAVWAIHRGAPVLEAWARRRAGLEQPARRIKKD